MSGPGEVRQTKGAGDEPWNRGKNVNKNVRPPRSSGGPEVSNVNRFENEPSPNHSQSQFDKILLSSNLNANAQEFVPRQPPLPQIPSAEDMSYLAEAIDVLTMNPGRYQEFLPPIEDIVENVIHDPIAVGHIIDVIIEQCVAEQNFRYTGGRLCRDLGQRFYFSFINCLLEKCSERFGQLQGLLEMRRDRVLGFGMVLAELFLQVTVDGSKHITALGNGVFELLNMLLAVPAYDSIRAICQILKLTAMPLDREGISTQQIFQTLEEMGDSHAVDENCRRIIAGLLHLRRTEWSTPEPVATPQPIVDHGNEPVFYSPDGQVMSEEERSFLLDNIPVSEDLEDYIVDNENEELDEAFDAAYDDFVSYSKNNFPGYRG